MKQKYAPPNWIFIDVDGTLSPKTIAWARLRKAEGFRFVLWSSRGKEYAIAAACKLKCTDVFEDIISKPGYIVDDKGWTWTRFTKVVRRLGDKLTK